MPKFTIIAAATQDVFPSKPWVQNYDYKKTGEKDGRFYELIKYAKHATCLERLKSALSAAWLLLSSFGKNRKQAEKLWNVAIGNKKITVRFGIEIPIKPQPSHPQASKEREEQIPTETPPKPKIDEPVEEPAPTGQLIESGSREKEEAIGEVVIEDDEAEENELFLQTYEEGMQHLASKDYKNAWDCFEAAAKAGYEPALHALRNLCEAKHIRWNDFYILVKQVLSAYEMVVLRLTDEERRKLKSAIENSESETLLKMGQDFDNRMLYPEAFMCCREALQLGDDRALELMNKLQTKNVVPTEILFTEYLDRANDLKNEIKKLNETQADTIFAVGTQYEALLANEGDVVLDNGIFEIKQGILARKAIDYYIRAAYRGHGQSVVQLNKFYEQGYINIQTVEVASLERHQAIKRMETKVKNNPDLNIYLWLMREFQREDKHQLLEQDHAHIQEWLRTTGKQDQELGQLKKGYNYKAAQYSSEAARMGNWEGMKTFGEYDRFLPLPFVQDVRTAYKLANHEKVQELLAKAKNNDLNAIESLADYYAAIKDQVNWDKCKQRLQTWVTVKLTT